MKRGDLRDAWTRQHRAQEHLRVLEKEFGLSATLKRHAVRPEMHKHGLEYRLYLIDTVEGLDPKAALLVSECLFNLRAALDHLVYQLHVRRYGRKITCAQERAAQFPVMDAKAVKRRGTNPAKWTGIKDLSKEQRTAINWLQPYIRRNDHLADTRMRLHALAILNNIDKHRRLHVTNRLVAPVSKARDFPPETGFQQRMFFCPLIADAYVERWTFTEPPTEMRVHNYVWSQVTIDEPTSNLRFYVHELLSWLVGDVDGVLRTFSRRFWGKYEAEWF